MVGAVVDPSRSSVTVTALAGLASLTAVRAVITAALEVVWIMTDSPDDAALLMTASMLVTVAASTVTEVVPALPAKSGELLV